MAFIAAHEGVVTRAYRDAAGIWTIGIGHTAAAGAPVPRAGMTITRAEAFRILANDLPRYEARVHRALGSVPQHAFDGAVSFDFNTGAVDRASWVAAFHAADWPETRRRLALWNKGGGRVLAGLVRRREAEAGLILDGRYGAAATNETDDDVRTLQRDLLALGFYRGVVDGISGPLTRAAVEAYQRQHPDLVEDGIAGPATRASLARDMAARKRTGTIAGMLGGAAAIAVPMAVHGAARPVFLAVAAIIIIAAIAGSVVVARYGGSVRDLFRKGNDP